ncbi:MAG: GAF domain-containing protein [Dehalococcoidia bacterium]
MTAANADLTAENARLRVELEAERRQHDDGRQREAAMADVLRLIGDTAGDPNRALTAVAEQAARFCGLTQCTIMVRDGDLLRFLAQFGTYNAQLNPNAITAPIHRDAISGRAVLERRTIHVADAATDAEYPFARALSAQLGHRTTLVVPLLRRDSAIGTMSAVRYEVRPFTPEEITLFERFAAHAVVAIDNARLFDETQQQRRELEERNAALTEALEQQTATSEILSIISSSPTDL